MSILLWQKRNKKRGSLFFSYPTHLAGDVDFVLADALPIAASDIQRRTGEGVKGLVSVQTRGGAIQRRDNLDMDGDEKKDEEKDED